MGMDSVCTHAKKENPKMIHAWYTFTPSDQFWGLRSSVGEDQSGTLCIACQILIFGQVVLSNESLKYGYIVESFWPWILITGLQAYSWTTAMTVDTSPSTAQISIC